MEQYNYLRECELEAAINQSRKEIATGNFVKESIEDQIIPVDIGTHDQVY